MSYSGRYELVSSDKFDEMLKAAGVIGQETRDLAAKYVPTLDITENGELFVIKTITEVMTNEENLKLNEETTKPHLDGVPWSSVLTREDGKLVQTFMRTFQPITVIRVTYELEGDKLINVHTVNGVTATRIFKRV